MVGWWSRPSLGFSFSQAEQLKLNVVYSFLKLNIRGGKQILEQNNFVLIMVKKTCMAIHSEVPLISDVSKCFCNCVVLVIEIKTSGKKLRSNDSNIALALIS